MTPSPNGRGRRGATAVELGMIAALIAVIVLAALAVAGSTSIAGLSGS
jgi:Flp pilus assembly pilin Flp